MSQNTEVKSKRTKRPTSELVAEIGRNRLTAIIRNVVPSQAAMDAVAAKEAEAAQVMESVKDVTDERVKDFAHRLHISLMREANAMREQLANPSKVSEFDRALIARAFKLANKIGAFSVVDQAVALETALNAFPIVGTKY